MVILTGIKHIIKPLIKENAKVLVIGCGNSRLSANIFDDCSTDVTSIDFSQVVIEDMKTKYRKKKGMQYIRMDARNMDFKDNTFDVIVDKGLTDCLLCGEEGEDDISNSMGEVSRVLKPGGAYFCCSFGDPETREDYFESKSFGWTLEKPISVSKPSISSGKLEQQSNEFHWCYIAKKSV
mmetsp:Transcript_27098/g.37718  ORF Transcript_27098/g.37718 Transcript_27098/m.37718 type:complete len:180 (+) Transcript_27098:277-816(+)